MNYDTIFPSSPPGLHLLSMDAQWMLKGCSMDAYAIVTLIAIQNLS